jgi:hypothetical protein
MSQRVIDDPAAAGWEFDADTGYWMWKGEEGTGGLWEQNGDDIYYEDGDVNIGRSDSADAVVGVGGESITASFNNGLYIARTGITTQYNSEGLYSSASYAISTGGTPSFAMNIDADGNTTFSGDVKMSTWYREGYGGLTTGNAGAGVSVMPMFAGSSEDNKTHLGDPTKRFKNGYFGGTVASTRMLADRVVQDGAPVIDAKGLISTLVTLRKATMDETQDIRESLRDAIDELVAGFEQEIAAMPAPEPEASTMDMVDE